MFVRKFPFKKMRPELVLFLVVRQSAHELSLKVSTVKRFSEGQSGIRDHPLSKVTQAFPFFCRSQKDSIVRSSIKVGGKGP